MRLLHERSIQPVGSAEFHATWDSLRGVISTVSGSVQLTDTTALVLNPSNPAAGQVGEWATVRATLTDSDGAPLADQAVTFTIESVSAEATTDGSGQASAPLFLIGPLYGDVGVQASFSGATLYDASSASAVFKLDLVELFLPVITK